MKCVFLLLFARSDAGVECLYIAAIECFVDILGVLVAALSRLFGLTTNWTLEPSVPTLRNTHCEWVLFLTVFLLAGCLRVAVG